MAGQSRRSRSKRLPVTLACQGCLTRNYKTTKAQREGAGPLSLRKYCKTCDAHTVHIEAK